MGNIFKQGTFSCLSTVAMTGKQAVRVLNKCLWIVVMSVLPASVLLGADAKPLQYPEPKITWAKKVEIKKDVTNYEAEAVLVNKEKISETHEPNKWFIYLEGDNKWSGDKTLQGEKIFSDRSPDAAESAALKFRIPLEKGKRYRIVVNGGRSYGISLDGKKFTKATGKGQLVVDNYEAVDEGIEFYIANCFADSNPGFTYIDWFEVETLSNVKKIEHKGNPPFVGFSKKRVEEKFDRRAVAVPIENGGMHVSWRLLREDAEDTKFDVFRVRGGKEEKLNTSPIEQTSDFTDINGKSDDRYITRPAGWSWKKVNGETGTERWNIDENGSPYLSIKLDDPTATVSKVGIVDLNGDGVYDYVVKTPNSSIDPYESFWKPSTQTYKISAYLADGTHLWTRDMGWGIECGMWYSPFIAYDFNGDGKAEVVIKTSEDKRDKDGRVYEGAENLVVLDGMTGKEIASAPWPNREGFENYNMASRNQLSLAYLDGKTPCIIALRGTYGTMKAEAWQLNGTKLESCWKFTNHEGPYDEGNKENCWQEKTAASPKYYGQGAHQTVVADLDGDGKDEVILGSFVLNGNGDPLWSVAKGHPDWVILTDFIWENPGMEIAYMFETREFKDGVCLVDAKTGKVLWGLQERSLHVHNGHAGHFDPTMSGPEILGVDHNVHAPIDGKYWRFTNTGKLLSNTREESGSPLKGVYWDGDLEKEILGGTIMDYRGGALSKIKGSLVMAADLFGDWREEVITTLPGEIRIYATTIPAMDRRVALMQEHPYRMKVAINSQAYWYDPNLPYLPAFESNNFSMVFKLNDENPDANQCQVTVSASKKAPVSGVVTLLPPDGISVDQASWKVDLKPGEISVQNVRVKGNFLKKSLILGELKENVSGKIYRAQVPVYRFVPKFKQPAGNVIKHPAAKYSETTGGSPIVAVGRPLAADGCLAGWDSAGHKITWKIAVPKEGNYRLMVQNAGNVDAKRRLTVNGEFMGEFHFLSTGGKGETVEEWNLTTFKKDGKPIVLKLGAGDVVIMLENTDNNMLNFAYLYLEPVD